MGKVEIVYYNSIGILNIHVHSLDEIFFSELEKIRGT
jgi:hypothetical protein